ncbi:MAG: cobalt ABC transporter substrate-binding protein [Lautropia sp.]
MKILTAAALLLGLATTASAHQIWIEQPDGQNAVIRFGEFGENLREASPGLLDKFGKPAGTLVSTADEKPGNAEKFAEGFRLPFRAGPGESIVAEDAAYPLYTWKQGDRSTTNWYHPAARLITDFSAQRPRLVLDLVPTGTPGQFALHYKGQPRPKTKVTLVTQSGWAKEATTDDKGQVTFDMPWKGRYVAEVSINERTAGERAGAGGAEKYDGISYATTLSYVKQDGIEPIPAAPPAPPNK